MMLSCGILYYVSLLRSAVDLSEICDCEFPVHKQPIIALYFEFETVLKFYNLETWSYSLIFKSKRFSQCMAFIAFIHTKPSE